MTPYSDGPKSLLLFSPARRAFLLSDLLLFLSLFPPPVLNSLPHHPLPRTPFKPTRPENFIFERTPNTETGTGVLKLCDFGLAKNLKEDNGGRYCPSPPPPLSVCPVLKRITVAVRL